MAFACRCLKLKPLSSFRDLPYGCRRKGYYRVIYMFCLLHRQLDGNSQLTVAAKGIEVNIWQIKSPIGVAFVDVQILTQGTCKPIELHTRFLMENGFATLLACSVHSCCFKVHSSVMLLVHACDAPYRFKAP